jgi:hypothetical protein
MNVVRRMTLAFTAVCTLILIPSSPAQAAPTAYQCDAAHDSDGVLVVFRDQYYGGECRSWSYPQVGDLRNFGINDDISSLKNRTPNTLCFYSNAGDGGLVFQIHAWEWWPTVPTWIDNQISSFDFC